MNALRAIIKKNGGWTLTHMGVVVLGLWLVIRPDLHEELTLYTGYMALFHLVSVLSLNPLRSILPASILLKKLNRYRREMGVACFSYALVHFSCFVVERGNFSEFVRFSWHPALISVLWFGFPMLFLLTVTSNNSSIKKMGFMRWKALHNKVYLVEGAVFIHMIILGAVKLALFSIIPLFIVQQIRRHRRQDRTGNRSC